MSLETAGVWAVGVWATTVWDDGVWFEGSAGVSVNLIIAIDKLIPQPEINKTIPAPGLDMITAITMNLGD